MKEEIDIFALNEKQRAKNEELGKLVQYAYDLHARDFVLNPGIPTLELYPGFQIIRGKKTKKGGIYGIRYYADHGSSDLLTSVGVFERNGNDIKAYFLETCNLDLRISCARLELAGNRFKLKGIGDKDDFVEAMSLFGFLKEDVNLVIEGKIKAQEAYRKIAPLEIRYLEWLDINRRHYWFDKNVAIQGDFGGKNLDKFPFPFEEAPILDCSKVSTAWVDFGENKRGVKLLHVNAQRKSILGVDLRTAIIEEPIDLSLVDASRTQFGHHTVVNLTSSIAPLSQMNLTFAVDEEGNNFVTNEKGQVINEQNLETKQVTIFHNAKEIKLFANADTKEMAQLAVQNNAEGIGLIRTENVLTTCSDEDFALFVQNYDYPKEHSLAVLKRLTQTQLDEILPIVPDEKVIIRLLDFKFEEFLRLHVDALKGKDFDEKELFNTRGTNGLRYWSDKILEAQLSAILDTLCQSHKDVNLLIPRIESVSDFCGIRRNILEKAKEYGISSIQIGAMVENGYSSCYMDRLAKDADFIAIGTNDLTESITGLSRASQDDAFIRLNDAVKKRIEEIIYRARAIKPEIEIGICGEHANYMENVRYYATLNIDYICCSPFFVKENQELLASIKEPLKVLQKAKGNSK